MGRRLNSLRESKHNHRLSMHDGYKPSKEQKARLLKWANDIAEELELR